MRFGTDPYQRTAANRPDTEEEEDDETATMSEEYESHHPNMKRLTKVDFPLLWGDNGISESTGGKVTVSPPRDNPFECWKCLWKDPLIWEPCN